VPLAADPQNPLLAVPLIAGIALVVDIRERIIGTLKVLRAES
jgi:hypothetical protein